MTYFEQGPKIIYVHDTANDNHVLAIKNAGIESPYSIVSYTDTFPDTNPYNKDITDVAMNADVVLIQKSLLRNRAGAAMEALRVLAHAPNKFRQIYLLDESYTDRDSLSGAMEVAWMEATR